MRKLASIREIKDISPIPKADAIECVTVDGWTVVSKKGEFKQGDKCVYFEIDSFLPAKDSRFDFLKKAGIKKDPSGEERIRLKTVKLRGQLSQGLALPMSLFPELKAFEMGHDVSEILNVIKYERPEPQVTNSAGYRPDCIPKTDEERIQNVYDEYSVKYAEVDYYATLKLDGSSCTVAFLGTDQKQYWSYEGKPDDVDQWKSIPYYDHGEKIGEVIVCSRNMQLKYDPNSHFWKAVEKHDLIDKVAMIAMATDESVAIQGEVCGPGIQGNKDKFNEYEFFAFNLFDITNQDYFDYGNAIKLFDLRNIQAVPLITQNTVRPFQLFGTMQKLLDYADGRSINAKYREGVVFKPAIELGFPSFKVISNQFLMKGGDE